MNRALAITVLLALLIPDQAQAHGFIIHVSTPITPPDTFRWLWPLSLLVFVVSLLLTFRCLRLAGWRESVIVSFIAVVAFAIVFYSIGRLWALSSTAPPAGLGPPSPVYLRWYSGYLQELFISWNVFGAIVFLAATTLAGRLWLPARRKKGVIVMAMTVLVYVALLTPFIRSGAFAHGWAGGYVLGAGQSQLRDINRACFRYAKDHGGKLPVAQDIQELLPQIKKYLETPTPQSDYPIYVCPAAWAFEKTPKTFVWNTKLSGQDAPKIPMYDNRELPVTCPYTEKHHHFRGFEDLEGEFDPPADAVPTREAERGVAVERETDSVGTA